MLCRYYVLYKLPKLTFLDSRPVTAMERNEAKRKGEFTKVVRPTSNVVSTESPSAWQEGIIFVCAQFEESGKSHGALGYTPLPQSKHVPGQHRGMLWQQLIIDSVKIEFLCCDIAVFGQCKYVYYGKHSEGNRFIRNNQL